MLQDRITQIFNTMEIIIFTVRKQKSIKRKDENPSYIITVAELYIMCNDIYLLLIHYFILVRTKFR